MHEAINQCFNINEDVLEFLFKIEQQMGIVADLSRADILLYGRQSTNEAVVLAHAQPNSIARVYNRNREGRVVDVNKRPEVLNSLISGKYQKDQRSFIAEGAPVVRRSYPIYFPAPVFDEWRVSDAKLIASLSVVTNLIEYERHRLRSEVFRGVIEKLQAMLVRGRINGAEGLTPFGEYDGVIYADKEGKIEYASGVATNLYRRIGYKESLIGRSISQLETNDEELRQVALDQMTCLEQEHEETGRVWIRKAIPILKYSSNNFAFLKLLNLSPPSEQLDGLVITIHDDTQTRRQDHEMRIKNAMIQEVHHRVKNNLQTIAGLIRMQSRRIESPEGKAVLDDTLNRILSVAVIHEFLSNENTNIINIREISQRIIGQFQYGMVSPDQQVQIKQKGDSVYLPARQATACSLIINELIQNALEHGLAEVKEGIVEVNLQDDGINVIISVSDNGVGVPSGFKIDESSNLGFQIIKILAEGDLRGQIDLSNNGNDSSTANGLTVTITFPKTLFEGEKGWKEHVSL